MQAKLVVEVVREGVAEWTANHLGDIGAVGDDSRLSRLRGCTNGADGLLLSLVRDLIFPVFTETDGAGDDAIVLTTEELAALGLKAHDPRLKRGGPDATTVEEDVADDRVGGSVRPEVGFGLWGRDEETLEEAVNEVGSTAGNCMVDDRKDRSDNLGTTIREKAPPKARDADKAEFTTWSCQFGQ